jgi:hypothetical protein
MITDPFSLKSQSKLSPRRLTFTARARVLDYVSRRGFARYAIPAKILSPLPVLPSDIAWHDTSVTELQMQHLVLALEDTEALGGCVVEVGSFRGVTTRCLAARTSRKVISVDPFIGHGALASDHEIFTRNVAARPSITHVRKTSGEAARTWTHGPASLVFIDAVHDYVNTAFDISVWWPLLVPGGIMAFHDTDDLSFAGTRRAVFELYRRGAELYAHPDDLTMLRKVA